jgi:proteasome lid subunit RPN8/RPN11
MFDKAVIEDFKQHAMACHPEEAVGLIIECNKLHSYMPCKNVADDPKADATVSRGDMIDANEKGIIAAVIHSHVNNKLYPSGMDMKAQLAMGIPFGLSTATKDSCSDPIWWGKGAPVAPLVGRRFVSGLWDCFSCARDFLRQEGIVDLPDFPHDHYWWDQGENLYLDNFKKLGFVQVDVKGQPQKGDCFLMRIRSKVPNHIGVYIGDDLCLHHLQTDLSKREPMNRLMDHIEMWLRYKPEAA